MTKREMTDEEKARDAERRLRGPVPLPVRILEVLAAAKTKTTSGMTIAKKLGDVRIRLTVERMSDDGVLIRRYCRRGKREEPYSKAHLLRGGPWEDRYAITAAGRRRLKELIGSGW